MFDALAHGLPFVATDLEFFEEFSSQGLGITVRRNSSEFSKALVTLDQQYDSYKESVGLFRKQLGWDVIAREHAKIYSSITERERESDIMVEQSCYADTFLANQ